MTDGTAYTWDCPMGPWLHDVQALGYLRPPCALAFDTCSPWAGRRTSAVDCIIDRPKSSIYDWLNSGDSVKTTCTGQEGLCTCCVSDTRRKGHDQP